MISIAIATALSAASAQAAPPPQPRRTYAACLSAFVLKGLDQKMDPAAFEAALRPACQSEEASFKKSLIDFDAPRYGQQQAQEDAEMQVEDYLLNTKAEYEGHLADGTRPGPPR